MAEHMYVLNDMGATQNRVIVVNSRFEEVGRRILQTDPKDYEGTIQQVADASEEIVDGHGQIVASSTGIAAEVDDNGILVKSGALNGWIGRRPATDLEAGLNLPEGRAGVHNDMVVVAISQNHVNQQNGRLLAEGSVVTLSSGFGGALFWPDGRVAGDEPGHEPLRPGQTCPCGCDGHVEAYISGKGVALNHGVPMKEWLQDPLNARTFVEDVAVSFTQMIERHQANGIDIKELRWTGGVALNQALLMQKAVAAAKLKISGRHPVFDLVTLGEYAGIHGTMIDAQKRALES